MPALRNMIALSLASLALTAIADRPAMAQSGDTDPVRNPDAARPGAIPMFKPPIYPWPKSTAPSNGRPAAPGNQVWIYPGGNGGTTVIINNNYPGGYYPGYYPGYPGVYVPGSNVTVTQNPGHRNPNVAPVVVNSNNAVLAGETAALRTALSDMTRAWERRDAAALGRHLAPDLSVAILEEERFRFTLQPANAYRYLTSLLGAVTTTSYRVYDVQLDGNDRAILYATHRYRTAGGRHIQTATVRSTLVNIDGRWSLTAISVAPGILPKESSQTSGISEAGEPRKNAPGSRP